ncbi:MAG: WD40 repeat domain-containing protein [Candidatus Poribacteria bacterium]|nr:WD40 repeat domain-containing protein [Candidatus Poribacteria bacterium]
MQNRTHLISESDAVDSRDVTTWALPEGAIARLGRGCEPDILFSPDGQYLAVGTWVGLWLYDLETLNPVALWETERGMIGCVTFSPNGKWIAISNSDHILKVLNLQNGGCITQLETDDYISGLTFSSDNQYLAAAYARSAVVEVWHAETCEPVAQYYSDIEQASFCRPISISPDMQLIASTGRSETYHNADEIVVWEVGSEQQIASLSEQISWVSTLCFSPCGRYLASGGEDGTVYVWDVETWQKVQSYADYGDVYRIIPSYTPDGILRAVIVEHDDTEPTTITVHDLESGEQLYSDKVWVNTVQFSDADDWGNTVVFSTGSQLAYECRHEFINVWTPDHPYRRQFTHSPISFPASTHLPYAFPTFAVFSDDGKTLAVKHHLEGVVLWDIASKRSRPAVNVESAGKNQFLYKTESGKLYVASIKEDNVTLWEADENGIPLIEGAGRKYWSAFPALSSTGTLFAYADEDGNIKVWDVQSGGKLLELTHPLKEFHEFFEEDEDYVENEEDHDTIKTLKFSYDTRLLASESTYGDVKLWDIGNGEEIGAFQSDTVPSIIGFSPCGQYLVCNGNEILFWNIAHRKLHKTGLNQGPYEFIKFSPDGQYLACSGGETFVYDLKQSGIHTRLSLPQECEHMHAAAFSACGKYLAAGAWWEEGMKKMPICLWEVETGKHLTAFWGHPTDVQALAISPDNKLLASASYDGTILLWDLTPYL